MGQLRNCPLPTFRVAHDVYEGYFVAIQPANGDSKPIWFARALSDPLLIKIIPIVFSFSTFIPRHGKGMFKSTILVGTLPKDCVGRWMKLKIRCGRTQILW